MAGHTLPRSPHVVEAAQSAFAKKQVSANPADSFPMAAGLLLGLGVGGFFDGIMLHQILQWHHMLSSAGYPADSVANLKINTLADGLFHAATYVFVLWGLGKLWVAARQPHFRWAPGLLAASMLMGFGLFNLVEGTVNHQILGIHHVNETVPQDEWIYWDIGFLLWGLAMLGAGWLLTRRYRRQSAGQDLPLLQQRHHPQSMLSAATTPQPGKGPDLSSESVAGEEDPGASLDLGIADSAGSNRPQPVSQPSSTGNPGDEAPEGTPGTGEGLCRECGGSGRAGDVPCPSCKGSGKVTVGIGGA